MNLTLEQIAHLVGMKELELHMLRLECAEMRKQLDALPQPSMQPQKE